jgi:ABC-type multidrug transport system permease subunit
MKTPTIIKKNFQRTLNMKTSSLILILGPLLLIGIIGFALHDTSIKNIKAGIYSEDADAEFVDTLTQKLIEKSIQPNYYQSIQACKEEVKNENLQLCIEIAPPSTNNFEQKNQNIILHVDFSKQRTVWNIIGQVQAIVDHETNAHRSTMINSIKTETQSIKQKTEENQATIDNALNKLYQIQSYLNQAEQINNENENELQTIIDTLEELEEDLEDSRSLIILAGLSTDNIDDSLKSLRQTIATLNSFLESSNSNPIIEAQTQVRGAITQLNQAKEDIKKINEKVDRINDEDFNKLINPINLQYESVLSGQSNQVSKNLEFLDFLFPSFLIFFILFNSIIFSASTRLKERKSPAYIRNIVSGVKQRIFIFGDYITSVILISIQTFGILFLASFFLNLSISETISPLILVTILSVAVFSLIGLTIGSIFNNQETVIITSISVSLLLFIFSSLVTPIETLPSAIAAIIKMTPLTIFETKLRLITIFNFPLSFSFEEITGLSIFTIASLTLIGLFSRKNKRKLI